MLSSQDGDVDSMDFRVKDLKCQRALNLNRDVGMDDEIARFKKDETNEEEIILREVISKILGVEMKGPLLSELSDGIILCRLFRRLVPSGVIKDPHTSNLNFLLKHENISMFTNACRSIGIPDVLLITPSYFENENTNLLVSGLFTFLVWVLNLGISNQSSKISVSQLLSQAESGGVDKCVDYMTARLCHRETSSDPVHIEESPPEEPLEESPQIQTFNLEEEKDSSLSASCLGHPSEAESSPVQLNTSCLSDQDRKKEWMLRHGVDPIVPVYDNMARKNAIENRIDKFLSVLSTRAHLVHPSHSSLLQAEESSSIALPVGDHEVAYMDSEPLRSVKHALGSQTHYQSSIQPEAKRRVIGAPSRHRVNVEKAQSIVRQQIQSPQSNPNIRFIERVGRPRMVAGAVWQPRYLEGVDENGNVVVPAIQVRSLPIAVGHSSSVTPSTQNDAAMEEEEPITRMHFSEESSLLDDQRIVREVLANHSVEEMERRLDQSIRDSLLVKNGSRVSFYYIQNNI